MQTAIRLSRGISVSLLDRYHHWSHYLLPAVMVTGQKVIMDIPGHRVSNQLSVLEY